MFNINKSPMANSKDTPTASVNLIGAGTNIEGEWDAVFGAIRRCHERLHEMGAPRITASLRVGTRTDRKGDVIDRHCLGPLLLPSRFVG